VTLTVTLPAHLSQIDNHSSIKAVFAGQHVGRISRVPAAGCCGLCTPHHRMASAPSDVPNRQQRSNACRADHVINQKEEDVVQRVMEITGGEGAYAALDPVAGDFTSTVSWGTTLPQAVQCSACCPECHVRVDTGLYGVYKG
jgi:threonine dehydrogenase-like Zn-dependent dehydrogenase